jgi:hypothetical protein
MSVDREGPQVEQHRRDQLQDWASATEKEIAEIQACVAPLELRLQAAKESLDLIRRLIRLTEGVLSTPSDRGGQNTPSPNDSPSAHSARKEDLEVHLEQILHEAGKPMHISAIRQELVNRAVPLPGRGDEANIIVRLRRAPHRFSRVGRGTYALATLGLNVVPPRRRRRTRRRKKL